jgi:hypothetical protein
VNKTVTVSTLLVGVAPSPTRCSVRRTVASLDGTYTVTRVSDPHAFGVQIGTEINVCA